MSMDEDWVLKFEIWKSNVENWFFKFETPTMRVDVWTLEVWCWKFTFRSWASIHEDVWIESGQHVVFGWVQCKTRTNRNADKWNLIQIWSLWASTRQWLQRHSKEPTTLTAFWNAISTSSVAMHSFTNAMPKTKATSSETISGQPITKDTPFFQSWRAKVKDLQPFRMASDRFEMFKCRNTGPIMEMHKCKLSPHICRSALFVDLPGRSLSSMPLSWHVANQDVILRQVHRHQTKCQQKRAGRRPALTRRKRHIQFWSSQQRNLFLLKN